MFMYVYIYTRKQPITCWVENFALEVGGVGTDLPKNRPVMAVIAVMALGIPSLKLGFMGFLRVSLVIYGMKPWDLWDETNSHRT